MGNENGPRRTIRVKTRVRRAWAAYLELSNTTEWIERKLWAPLDAFGLTREEFRLLVTLYRDGPLSVTDAAEKLARVRQNLHATIHRVEEFGWVRRKVSTLPPANTDEKRLPKWRRGRPRKGRRVSRVSLTPEGRRLIGNVLPKQEHIVKSLMHGLNSTEIDSLVRICRKLRESILFPFWKEMMRQRQEFDASPEAELVAPVEEE